MKLIKNIFIAIIAFIDRNFHWLFFNKRCFKMILSANWGYKYNIMLKSPEGSRVRSLGNKWFIIQDYKNYEEETTTN